MAQPGDSEEHNVHRPEMLRRVELTRPASNICEEDMRYTMVATFMLDIHA